MNTETLTTADDLDLAKLDDVVDRIVPVGAHGLLGARVGGGNPLFPMLRDHVDRVRVPLAVHRSLRGFPYGMLGNDVHGDCVEAWLYHSLQHSRQTAGRDDAPKGDDALARCTLQAYSEIAGFDPANPATDNGTDPAQAAAYWQSTGIPLPDGSRNRIAGAAQVLPHDGLNVRRAIWEFDAVGISLALPHAWQDAEVWDVGGDPLKDPDWQPGGWGGHQVTGVSFDQRRLFVITWPDGHAAGKLITWDALGMYGQLVIARVSQDQIGKGGVSETGVNFDTLAADLPAL